MNTPISLLDAVALTEAVPEFGLVEGQVGTVVESHAPAVFEVEFSDDQGRTYTMATLSSEQLIVLHYGPVAV